jgi:putative transposase
MPNHIHFLIRVKSKAELIQHWLSTKKTAKVHDFTDAGELVSNTFSNLFNSYTKSYNTLFGRKGSLFIPRFKRKLVNSQEYLLTLVHYIHHNPVKAGLSENLLDWSYSSYGSIVMNDHSVVRSNEVVSWFDNVENFISVHRSETPFGSILEDLSL